MIRTVSRGFGLIGVAVVLTACGGGGDDNEDSSPDQVGPTATSVDAAKTTAANSDDCKVLPEFYWEIGDVTGALVSGSVGSGAVGPDEQISIASASKWLYSSYVVETKKGNLDADDDVPYLDFTSGYSNFGPPACGGADTVASCFEPVPVVAPDRDQRNSAEAADHIFHYDSGHMQKHAIDNGLGSLDSDALAKEVGSVLGFSSDSKQFTYSGPQLAGGVQTTSNEYAKFLRRLLADSSSPLLMGKLLIQEVNTASEQAGYVTCTLPDSKDTNGSTCNAAYSPLGDLNINWHYGIGHWIESPGGDGAFSSGGALGFYPWVDNARKYYGIVAREDKNVVDLADEQIGYLSGACGAKIRTAWNTGKVQN